MSISPKEAEVERAKSQLKASLLLSLDGTSAIAEDIGRQVVTSGRRFTPKQIENAIEAVTVDEIKRVAQKYLWDKDVSLSFFFTVLPSIFTRWPFSLLWLLMEESRDYLIIKESVRTCRGEFEIRRIAFPS